MKTALFAGTAALALVAGTASGAPTLRAKAPVHRVISAIPGAVTLYDQTSAESSSAISSQNFTSGAFADYDDQAADDFTVPSGHKWKVTEVDVPGVTTGVNPATSLNVIFYRNSHGLPGAIVRECDNQSSAGYDGSGGYAIKLDNTCTSHPGRPMVLGFEHLASWQRRPVAEPEGRLRRMPDMVQSHQHRAGGKRPRLHA